MCSGIDEPLVICSISILSRQIIRFFHILQSVINISLAPHTKIMKISSQNLMGTNVIETNLMGKRVGWMATTQGRSRRSITKDNGLRLIIQLIPNLLGICGEMFPLAKGHPRATGSNIGLYNIKRAVNVERIMIGVVSGVIEVVKLMGVHSMMTRMGGRSLLRDKLCIIFRGSRGEKADILLIVQALSGLGLVLGWSA